MQAVRDARLAAQLEQIAASHPGARFVEAHTHRTRTRKTIVSFVEPCADGSVRYGSYVLASDGRILAATGAAHAPGDQLGLLAA